MADAPQFTTVNLLTGFLGSGKTTLLKEMLQDPALADTAVLINEFGEIGLDHQLVERIDDNMVLLQSGCLCCTVRGELAEALRDLHSRRERGLVPAFSRVVIESTGLADPFPVLSTIKADPVLRHHFRPGNVITTVDAVNGEAQLDTYVESNRQAAIADRLVITKTDLGRVVS
jgi:G3E family GTPase